MDESVLLTQSPRIIVVMVEPRIPQNVGNVARLCACVGAVLYLVGDCGFELGDKFLHRAGMDYLEHVTPIHVPDMSDVVKKYPEAVSFYLSTKATRTLWDVKAYPKQVMLVFGREDKGLPEWVMAEYPDQSIKIPMPGMGRSLNVANSVAVGVYDVLGKPIS